MSIHKLQKTLIIIYLLQQIASTPQEQGHMSWPSHDLAPVVSLAGDSEPINGYRPASWHASSLLG